MLGVLGWLTFHAVRFSLRRGKLPRAERGWIYHLVRLATVIVYGALGLMIIFQVANFFSGENAADNPLADLPPKFKPAQVRRPLSFESYSNRAYTQFYQEPDGQAMLMAWAVNGGLIWVALGGLAILLFRTARRMARREGQLFWTYWWSQWRLRGTSLLMSCGRNMMFLGGVCWLAFFLLSPNMPTNTNREYDTALQRLRNPRWIFDAVDAEVRRLDNENKPSAANTDK